MDRLLLMPIDIPDANKLKDAYEVAEDILTVYQGVTIAVPKFFQYDGASIPEFAWQIIGSPFAPRLMLASVFHDWIYHIHQVPRGAADQLLYDKLVASGVDPAKAGVMKLAVELGGGAYWQNDAQDLAYIQRLADRIRADGRNPADYGIP